MKKNAAPSELRIRGCDSAVIAKLDELAAERGITRTLLAREILENYVYRVLITQKSVNTKHLQK